MDIVKYVLDQFPAGYEGTAVDVGANDGVFLSLTLPLEEAGWRVLCIEPNPLYRSMLHGCRREVMDVACAAENADEQDFSIVSSGENRWAAYSALHPCGGDVVEVVKVPVRRLDWCLAKTEFTGIDFVQIDAEGGDMDVLRGLDLTVWSPRVIVVENWSRDPRFVDYLTPYHYTFAGREDDNEVFRAADAPIEEP